MHSPYDDVELVELPEQSLIMKRMVSEEHSDDISVLWVEIRGKHRRMKTDRSTRVYYVIEGTASFTVGDDATFTVGPKDAVVIPRGTPYEFTGDLEYLVINSPAWRRGDDIDVE